MDGFENGKKPRVSVSFQRRFDLGNYEHVQASITISHDVETTEEVQDVIDRCSIEAATAVYSLAAEEAEESRHPSLIVQRFVQGKAVQDLDNF